MATPLVDALLTPLLDSWLDLAFGGVCVGCRTPGRVLCRGCEASLPLRSRPASPTPRPDGLVETRAAGPYAGLLGPLVVAHKERQAFALVRPLGDLVAVAARDLVDRPSLAGARVLLVPVPSRPVIVARRGHDPMLRVARRAAHRLRTAGLDVHAVPLLRQGDRPQDQGDLGGAARRENVRHTMAVRAGVMRALARDRRPAVAVVADDVVTTGSTAREAQRALQSVGVAVAGVACVATTAWAPGSGSAAS